MGMRVVRSQDELDKAWADASAQAQAAFGRGEMFLERFLDHPRHIEVQILADTDGTVVHLGERECSLQRRHQKLLEEAPSPSLTPAQRAEVCEAARRLAAAGGYVNAGLAGWGGGWGGGYGGYGGYGGGLFGSQANGGGLRYYGNLYGNTGNAAGTPAWGGGGVPPTSTILPYPGLPPRGAGPDSMYFYPGPFPGALDPPTNPGPANGRGGNPGTGQNGMQNAANQQPVNMTVYWTMPYGSSYAYVSPFYAYPFAPPGMGRW